MDPKLAPIFERAISGGDWSLHLATMRDFWSSVMLTSGRYKGQPMAAHVQHEQHMTAENFARWLELWGDTAEQAHERLVQVVAKIEQFIAASRRGRLLLGAPRTPTPPADERRRLAEIVLPAVRGALSGEDRVILHHEDGDDVLVEKPLLGDELTRALRAALATRKVA